MSYLKNVNQKLGGERKDKTVLQYFYRSNTFKSLNKEIREQILNSDQKIFAMFYELFKAEFDAAEKLSKAFEKRNAEILSLCNEKAKKIYQQYLKEKEESLNWDENANLESLINNL